MDDAKRFETLALQALDSLYSYAMTLTGRRADAEDLLQEALLRAYRRFETFDHTLSFKAWAFAIVRHAHVDLRRRAHLTAHVAGAPGLPDDARHLDHAGGLDHVMPLDPEGILLRGETVERVREAIRRLPPDFREVVELREIEGLSYQEIAHVINRPAGTVMSRLSRGRALLRTHLEEPRPARQGAGATRGL